MTIFAYLFSALSTYVLFRGPTKNVYAHLTPALHIAVLGGIFYSIFAIYGAEMRTLLYVGVGFTIGIPFYLWGRRDATRTQRINLPPCTSMGNSSI
jgi:hypothetical protein